MSTVRGGFRKEETERGSTSTNVMWRRFVAKERSSLCADDVQEASLAAAMQLEVEEHG